MGNLSKAFGLLNPLGKEEKRMQTFTFEKVSNMVFLTSEHGLVWYAWDESEFTERKKLNAIARIKKQFNNMVCFVFGF